MPGDSSSNRKKRPADPRAAAEPESGSESESERSERRTLTTAKRQRMEENKTALSHVTSSNLPVDFFFEEDDDENEQAVKIDQEQIAINQLIGQLRFRSKTPEESATIIARIRMHLAALRELKPSAAAQMRQHIDFDLSYSLAPADSLPEEAAVTSTLATEDSVTAGALEADSTHASIDAVSEALPSAPPPPSPDGGLEGAFSQFVRVTPPGEESSEGRAVTPQASETGSAVTAAAFFVAPSSSPMEDDEAEAEAADPGCGSRFKPIG